MLTAIEVDFPPKLARDVFVLADAAMEKLRVRDGWRVISLPGGHDLMVDAPEDVRPGNLAALCQKCHNGHDAKSRASGIKDRRRAALNVKELPI